MRVWRAGPVLNRTLGDKLHELAELARSDVEAIEILVDDRLSHHHAARLDAIRLAAQWKPHRIER